MFSDKVMTKVQFEFLRNYFVTMKQRNERHDIVRSTGGTGGRAESLNEASLRHDEALKLLVDSFEEK